MTFPQIAAQVASGGVKTHGAYFGVATGRLSVLDRKSGEFHPVAASEHAKAFAKPRF
jgi:carbonic anhydrase